jgi:solute carrier family 25 carnitine/acylcarnitine transporter 20/29
MTDKSNELVSHIIGSIINTYIGHPFDTVKIHMQDTLHKKETIPTHIKSIYKNNGLYGFFRGTTASLYSTIIENSVAFASNDYIKKNLYNVNKNTSLSVTQDLMVGLISGLLATVVACPFETIKCNMQISKNNMYGVWKEYRLKGLYNGLGASCVRNIPFYLLFFPFYTRYIELLSYNNTIDNKLLKCSLAGGLSGVSSWAVIYPFDCIKSNQQLHTNKISMINMAKSIYIIRGVRGLYSGYIITLVRGFFANAGLVYGIEMN